MALLWSGPSAWQDPGMGAAGPLELAVEGLSAGSAYGQTLAELALRPSLPEGNALVLEGRGVCPIHLCVCVDVP